MKKVLISLVLLVSTQAFAIDTDKQLIPQQEVKLLKLLNQMDPELVEELLSEVGVEWYIKRTQQFEGQTFSNDSEFESVTQPAPVDFGSYDDANAPKFN